MPRGIKLGSKCREGCSTRKCKSYSDCLRNASIRVAYTNSTNGWDASREKSWTAENDRYSQLVASGIEPQGVTHADMDKAERKVETSAAYADAFTKGDYDIS